MDIEAELRNWARWVRERRMRGHCRSFEHRYRSPRGAEVEWETAPPLVPLPAPDALAAIQVEACMHLLPDGQRKALKFVYLYGAEARWCCRRLALRHSDWPEFLEAARRMLANRLTTQESARRFRSHHLPIPSPDETPEPARLRGLWAEGMTEEPA